MENRVERSTVGNLTLISEQVPGLRSISLGLWIDRGSRDENEAIRGLSHLYEHMVFKGTGTRSPEEIARVLEKRGGLLNAFTGKEHICLYARFVDDALPEACDVLRDLFCHPLLSAEDLEKEKKVILEEIRGCEDDPEDFVHEQLMGALFPNDPLGAPITGTGQSVSRLSRVTLQEFCCSLYGARLVIAASGNLRHKDLIAAFSRLPLNGKALTRSPLRSASVRCLRVFKEKKIQQANIAVGFPICGFSSVDKYAFMALNILLGEGMSSRLFQKLREEMGLVYSVYSFLDAFFDTGLFGVYFGTDPERSLSAVRAVLKEINDGLSGGFTAKDLDFAKSYLQGNVLLSMENTTNRMIHLARSELYYRRYEPVSKTLEHIERVRPSDFRRIRDRYFSPEKMGVAVVAPKGSLSKRSLAGLRFGR